MLKTAVTAIFANFRLKLLALVISLGVWFYANSRVTQQIDVRAAVEIVPPDGYGRLLQSPETVRVRIAGPSWLIGRLETHIVQGIVKLKHKLTPQDLNDPDGGWAEVDIDRQWLSHSLSKSELVQLDLRTVNPPAVKVFVSPLRTRDLPVVVRFSGQLPPGLRLAQPPSIEPPEVTVRGPAIALDTIEAMHTKELPLWQVNADVKRSLPLEDTVEVALSDGTRLIVQLALNHSSVEASLSVKGREEIEQLFEEVHVDLLRPADFPYEAELQGVGKVSVLVRGTPEELRNLSAETITAYLNLRSLASEEIEVGSTAPYAEQVKVVLPPNFAAGVVRVEPARLTLLLKKPAK